MADDETSIKLLIEAEDRSREAFDQAKRRTEDLKKAEADLWRQVNDSQKTANASGQQWLDLRKQAVQTGVQLQRAYGAQSASLQQLVTAHNAVAAASTKHGQAATSAFGAAGNALLHYGKHFLTLAAVEEGVRRSIEAYSQFERGMARIEMESGATAKQMDHLGHSFEGLARLTGSSVEQLQGQFRSFRDVAGGSLDTTVHAFEDIVKAAHAAGVSVETMSRIGISAVKTMEVPFSEMKGMLDTITQTVPASMLQAWEQVGPKILSTLRSIGATGKEHVEQAATAFMHLSQVMGSSEKGASVFAQLMQKSTDLGGNFGKVMVPQLIAIDKAGGTANDRFRAIYETMQKLGIDSDDPLKRLFIQQKFGFSEETVRGAREYKARIDEIDDVAKKLNLSFDEVEKRVLRLNRGPMAAVDDLKGAVSDLWTELGKLLGPSIPQNLANMITGIKHDVAVINEGFAAIRRNILLTESPEGKPTTRAEETLRRMQEHQAKQEGRAPPAGEKTPELSIMDFLFGKDKSSWYQLSPFGYPTQTPEQSARQKLDAEIAKRKRLRGFALGGSFEVPGQGGSAVDTEPVGFMAKPGERVDVTTPMQESLQVQQDKADQAMREHFARFHTSAFTKTSGAPWWPAGGVRQPGQGGAGASGASGAGGIGGTPGGTSGGGGGDNKDGNSQTNSGSDPPGTGNTPLKTPTNLDITSPQGPAQDIKTAVERGYLKMPDTGGGAGTVDRSSLANQLTPDMVAKLAGLTTAEVGGDPERRKAFVATLLNRTLIESGNINKQTNNGYYPGTQNNRVDAKSVEDFRKNVLEPVMRGEGGTRTHNASNAVGNPVADNAIRKYGPGSGEWVGSGKNKEYFYTKTGEQNKLAKYIRKEDASAAQTGNPTVGTASSVKAAVYGGQTFDAQGNVIDAPQVTSSDGSGAGVIKMKNKGAIRDKALSQDTKNYLEYASLQTGLEVHVGSGGQDRTGPKRTGSHRHDDGGAADYKLWDPAKNGGQGGYLDMRNKDDRVRMQEFVKLTSKAGATGQGAGLEYMGPETIHTGGGTEATWKSQGQPGGFVYAGHNEGKKERLTRDQLQKELIRLRAEQAAKIAAKKEAANKPAVAPTNTRSTTDAPADGGKKEEKAAGKSPAAVAAHSTNQAAKSTAPAPAPDVAAGKGPGAGGTRVTPPPAAAPADKPGGIGSRQWGGIVRAGQQYNVGESGPETFMPNVPGQIVPGGMDVGSMMGQYRQFTEMLRTPITPNLQMPRVGPMQRRMSRRVEDQRERDVGRMSRHASHSDIGFT